MAKLHDYSKEELAELLGTRILDSTDASIGGAGLAPDTTNRTILIGVGGTGLRTLDYVKGTLRKRLAPTWSNYVSFLAIDTDRSDLSKAHYLTLDETIATTRSGVTDRMNQMNTYPPAVHQFMIDNEMDPGNAVPMGNLNTDGASQIRLIGKIKIHDMEPGAAGVDEEIVQKISAILANMPLPAGGKYYFYVIGSGSGGTGSGGILEMPALIRKALGGIANASINCMLYLPDTLTSLAPTVAGKLKANGYATLKELNYYQGMEMRPNTEEKWAYNDPANPTLTLTDQDGFYTIPYLVGASGAAAANSAQVAQESIAEFLISLLVQETQVPGAGITHMVESFESNALSTAVKSNRDTLPADPNREKGYGHEFPKCFAAIGFAQAVAPEKVIRAYEIGEACRKSGMSPVSKEERDAILADTTGTRILPFSGIDQYEGAAAGTRKVDEILEPFSKFLSYLHQNEFSFENHIAKNDPVTWENIRDHKYEDQGTNSMIGAFVKNATRQIELDKIKQALTNAKKSYVENVIAYVKSEGPYAFWNLFDGKFIPQDGDEGRGIRQTLENLMNGRKFDGTPYPFKTKAEWHTGREQLLKAICEKKLTLGFLDLHGDKPAQRDNWVKMINAEVNAQINEERRKAALQGNGFFKSVVFDPATLLAEQIRDFGDLLSGMTTMYSRFGLSMKDATSFANAKDNESEVNIAALEAGAYQWLKNQADQKVAVVQAKATRDGLIDDFFAHREDWLNVPDDYVVRNPSTGHVALTTPDRPIPGREKFDQFVNANVDSHIDVSILSLFTHLKQQGIPYDKTAASILSNLKMHAKPLFNGEPDQQAMFSYIKYPNSLNSAGEEGPLVVAAIQNAAAALGGSNPIKVYASCDSDSILMYTLACSMEVCRLKNDLLSDWEHNYELECAHTNCTIHSKSPDTKLIREEDGRTRYVEYTRWKDFPNITWTENPELPDASGKISREGECRIALENEMKAAKELGILYCEPTNTADGRTRYQYRYVDFNPNRQWSFDLTMLDADENNLMPTGSALAEAIAQQNQTTLAQISRKVYLNYSQLFTGPAATEQYAWKYAMRILRANIHMVNTIRHSVRKMREWNELVATYNNDVLANLVGARNAERPQMMMNLIRSRILQKTEAGKWVYTTADGKQKNWLNHAPTMLPYIAMMDAKNKKLCDAKLLTYLVYEKVNQELPAPRFDGAAPDGADFAQVSDPLFEESERGKRIVFGWMTDGAGDEEMLEKSEEIVAQIRAEGAELVNAARAMCDDPAQITDRFFREHRNIADNKDLLQDIVNFYSNI